MELYDGTELYWDERSLFGLNEEQIEDKAASMIKKATGDKEHILLTVVVLDIGIPYKLVTKLIDDGRIYVIPDKSEEEIEKEKLIRERYDELKKKLFEMNGNLIDNKTKNENIKNDKKNKNSKNNDESKGGMHYNK
jgi:hypothetical protein